MQHVMSGVPTLTSIQKPSPTVVRGRLLCAYKTFRPHNLVTMAVDGMYALICHFLFCHDYSDQTHEVLVLSRIKINISVMTMRMVSEETTSFSTTISTPTQWVIIATHVRRQLWQIHTLTLYSIVLIKLPIDKGNPQTMSMFLLSPLSHAFEC